MGRSLTGAVGRTGRQLGWGGSGLARDEQQRYTPTRARKGSVGLHPARYRGKIIWTHTPRVTG